MEWNAYQTKYEHYKRYSGNKRKSVIDFYEDAVESKQPYSGKTYADDHVFLHLAEMAWHELRRPFYRVYPVIFPCLEKISLDIDSVFTFPPDTVKPYIYDEAHQHYSGKELAFNPISVVFPKNSVKCSVEGVSCYLTGMLLCGFYEDGQPIRSVSIFQYDTAAIAMNRTVPGHTVKDKLEERRAARGDECTEESAKMYRIAIALNLLSRDNSELLKPLVLKKDREKFENADDELKRRLIERAQNRGLNGFELGGCLESSPHVRRPHFAIRWTGKGGKVPKLRPIKASVVNRKKITEVPSGYGD